MGLQWHPQGYQTGGARSKATPGAIAQSDELMKAFDQAMSAYGAKQQVNAELRQKVSEGSIKRQEPK